MDNLQLAISVVFPLCFYIFIGYISQKFLKIERNILNSINKIVFSIFLPFTLFKSIYESDLTVEFNIKLIIFIIICVLINFIFLISFLPKIEKDKSKISSMAQGVFRGNYILFGIIITEMIFGSKNLGVASIVGVFYVPLSNIFTVIIFEIFRGEKIDFKNIVKQVLKNPLIIASLIGIIFLVSKIKLPSLLVKSIGTLGGTASPVALFILGMTFRFDNLKENKKQLTIVLLLKIIVTPIIFLSAGIMLGFRTVELIVLMTVFASPTAVSSFVTAEQMGGDGELAGQIIVLTTIFSAVGIFLWIYIFGVFKLI